MGYILLLRMPLVRPLLLLALGAVPSLCATFGTVVAHAQPLADLAVDEARRRLYVVNTASNQIEVYATNTSPPRLSSTIRTNATPLAIAMSRSGRYLYVACYSASSLDIIDLGTANFASRSVTLPASPEAVAVGFDERVLISTIGTGVGQGVLMVFDPGADAARASQAIVIAPPAPAVPTLPPPNGVMALASRARLLASRDGRTIIGVHLLANNTRTMFVYDADSSTVLASRNTGVATPVLAVSPDGARFMSGHLLFDSSTLHLVAQQNALNSPHAIPTTANFNLQTTQGGAVFAETPAGPLLIAAYNIVPVQVPAARPNTSQLLINHPDNLLIQLGIQLPETLSGKMVITSDSSTIYAISQSGFIVLPIGTLQQQPLAMPDTTAALLALDQCGVTGSQNAATIPVRNFGGRTFTATAQVMVTSATATTVRVTPRPYGADVTAQFSAGAARTRGTSTPDLLLIQSPEAVNIIPNVRVFQNYRNSEARGTVIPIPTGAGSSGLTDLLTDAARQRVYIANPGMNRIEVFDMRRQELLAPITVGQLPRTMAFGNDTNTLYVANSGGESISIVDLSQGAVVGRVNYPPIPFNSSFAVITPLLIAASQRGPQVLMSDGTLWKIVGDTLVPRTFNTNIFGTARSVPGPQTMAATPDGAFILLLSGTGMAYLYDASIDEFVSLRQVVGAPIQGYYGPIAAGPAGQYYLVNGDILNAAPTSIGSGAGTTGPVRPDPGLPPPSGPSVTSRPVSAVTAVGAQTFARFSMPLRASAATAPSDPGLIELVEVATQRVIASAGALEGPLSAAIGTTRVNINGRTMAVDPSGSTAFVLTTSGLSMIPLSPATTQNVPQLGGLPVLNAANFSSAVAPGGLISIIGRNLASDAVASTSPLPTLLGGSCVTLNNVPLHLLATTPGQINAQLPPTLAAGRYPLVVRSISGRAASNPANVTVSRYAPAVFLDSNGPVILHANGIRVNKSHPAKRDEPLTIYATGLGVTTGGRVTAGMPAPSDPLAVTGPVQVFFGNPLIREAAVIVDWSGLAPGLIGTYMIKCRVPGAHIKGEDLPVTVRIGGVSSITTGPSAARVFVD
jgi:uncharacterized protein (TIGR03437 family)